jgi:hypothetical protein
VRTARDLVDEVNRLAGDGTLALVYSFWGGGMEIRCGALEISLAGTREDEPLTPAEQCAILEAAGLELLIPALGLDAPEEGA